MLKLIKKGKELTKEEMLTSKGGSVCGTMGCDCGEVGTAHMLKQDDAYTTWKKAPYPG